MKRLLYLIFILPCIAFAQTTTTSQDITYYKMSNDFWYLVIFAWGLVCAWAVIKGFDK
ncbi:MAG TPA: hypothetical protein VHC91_05755 [Trinickia sp.]|uniref:hypothetical protein n=1 Tax=Trinickia sp. TaxID=2571163 RepID=UPI002C0B5DC9|nr:hypothetical protein [Trinickia sp.]HVW49897.1 hypothetical protein [Trinickia sp.]